MANQTIVLHTQIASPSKSRLGFPWPTVGPWDSHGLGLAHSHVRPTVGLEWAPWASPRRSHMGPTRARYLGSLYITAVTFFGSMRTPHIQHKIFFIFIWGLSMRAGGLMNRGGDHSILTPYFGGGITQFKVPFMGGIKESSSLRDHKIDLVGDH